MDDGRLIILILQSESAYAIIAFFFSCYGGKAPARLFVVLIVIVQPFADEMANYTCHDGN